MTADDFWSDRFHACSLAAGFIAAAEGRLEDSAYVKALAYGMYESGAFAGRAAQPAPAGARNGLVRLTAAAAGALCDSTNGTPGRAGNEGG